MTTQRNTKRGLAFLGIFVLGLLAGGFLPSSMGAIRPEGPPKPPLS